MYKHNEKVIKAGQAWTSDDGVQHPKQWNQWSEEEKTAAGLVYEDDPVEVKVNTKFYWSAGNPKALEDKLEFEKDAAGNETTTPIIDERTGEQMITKGLKSNAIALVKRQAGDILAKTGWYVERFNDPSSQAAIPQEVLDYRGSVRTKSNEIEQLITECTTLEQFMALYDTPVDADGVPTGNAPIVDWPTED